jgi:hypothetical protein
MARAAAEGAAVVTAAVVVLEALCLAADREDYPAEVRTDATVSVSEL